jgi:hypothetical protein
LRLGLARIRPAVAIARSPGAMRRANPSDLFGIQRPMDEDVTIAAGSTFFSK